MGSLVALNSIITNNLNPNYSSFFFCTLLFYLFFEVFFSFLRKVAQKKSPIHPDNKHLHMLIYRKNIFNFWKR
jgi:UDP-N-acetylmuramyl pentapeptide phosphotransferase/UDP-N-acetylglucosamine-1-phosphate transferase